MWDDAMFSKIKQLFQKKYLKIGDFVLILVLLILSFIPASIFLKKQTEPSTASQVTAYIRVNNHVVKKIPLKHGQHFTWTFQKAQETNVVKVDNQRIRVIEANCKDQVCVKQGWKSKPGESIVCLPHKLLIELRSSNKDNSIKSKKPTSKKDFDNTLVNP